MGRNFDDYSGLQFFTGMPILLQQSVYCAQKADQYEHTYVSKNCSLVT